MRKRKLVTVRVDSDFYDKMEKARKSFERNNFSTTFVGFTRVLTKNPKFLIYEENKNKKQKRRRN